MKLRNIITISNMEPGLEEWAREEAKRQGKPFYQVINEALELLRLTREGAEKRTPRGRRRWRGRSEP